MPYVARKGITLAGTKYGAGEQVPLGELDLPHRLVRALIDQRKLVMLKGAKEPPQHEKPALTPKAVDAETEADEEEQEEETKKKALKAKAKSSKEE